MDGAATGFAKLSCQPSRTMRRFLNFLGRSLRGILNHVGHVARLLAALAAALARFPTLNLRVIGKIASLQVRFTGLQAVPLVAALAAAIGAVGIMEFTN